MDISVMLVKVKDNGYRATAVMPTPLVAEASTRGEAVRQLRAKLDARLSQAEVIQVEVATSATNPWLGIAGSWSAHPDVDEVEENIRE
jgi:hypothetical protein